MFSFLCTGKLSKMSPFVLSMRLVANTRCKLANPSRARWWSLSNLAKSTAFMAAVSTVSATEAKPLTVGSRSRKSTAEVKALSVKWPNASLRRSLVYLASYSSWHKRYSTLLRYNT